MGYNISYSYLILGREVFVFLLNFSFVFSSPLSTQVVILCAAFFSIKKTKRCTLTRRKTPHLPKSIRLFMWMLPCFCSLSQLVRWLGMKAEELGVEIYPGFAASEVFIQVLSHPRLWGFVWWYLKITWWIFQVLYDTTDTVIGIRTNDMGVAKDGSKKDNYQLGVELRGYISLFSFLCFNANLKLMCVLYLLYRAHNASGWGMSRINIRGIMNNMLLL